MVGETVPPPVVKAAQWSLASLLLLLSVTFIGSSGTGDVDIWMLWAERVDALGLRGAFAANGYYPPLATALCWAGVRAGGWLGLDPHTGIMLTIALFQVAGTIVVLRWTRSLPVALGFHGTVFLATAHGYLDIVATLPLLLSLWALRDKRLTSFAVLFALGVLIKWQALIIAPFLAVHVIATTRRPDGGFDVRTLANRVVLPALAAIVAVLYPFGAESTLGAFNVSVSHDALSGDALNLGWIVTHLLLVFDPHFGGLVNGKARWINDVPTPVMATFRLIFVLGYVWTLAVYTRRTKTFERLLTFALLGFFAYFILNAGVHENHLFFHAVLAVLVIWLRPDAFWPALVVIIMSNINLLLFLGLDGGGLPFSRVLAERYDMALPMAAVYVAYFCWFWGSEVLTRSSQETCV